MPKTKIAAEFCQQGLHNHTRKQFEDGLFLPLHEGMPQVKQ